MSTLVVIGYNEIHKAEEVRLTFKAPERAATVEPVGWDDPAAYLTLVMPLRLID